MNLLEYKKHELEQMSNYKNDISYKYLKWFLNKAEYITDTNLTMSRKLGLKAVVKDCYGNSFRNRKGLRYYEGYIWSKLCPIPLEHAYLVDNENKIVDPTLGIPEHIKVKQFKKLYNYKYKKTDSLKNNQYIGIHVPDNILMPLVLKRKTYENNLIELFLKNNIS